MGPQRIRDPWGAAVSRLMTVKLLAEEVWMRALPCWPHPHLRASRVRSRSSRGNHRMKPETSTAMSLLSLLLFARLWHRIRGGKKFVTLHRLMDSVRP